MGQLLYRGKGSVAAPHSLCLKSRFFSPHFQQVVPELSHTRRVSVKPKAFSEYWLMVESILRQGSSHGQLFKCQAWPSGPQQAEKAGIPGAPQRVPFSVPSLRHQNLFPSLPVSQFKPRSIEETPNTSSSFFRIDTCEGIIRSGSSAYLPNSPLTI